MAVLLSLLAALSYGLSDFVGGVVARRVPAWAVAVVGQVASAAATAVLAASTRGTATGTDLAWAALAGVGGGVGTGFLYRGLASGRMGVVAPVSAVGAAVVPVVAGLVTGERPSALVWVGVVAALPGIWLVSSEPATPGAAPAGRGGLVDGILAGLGFGLLFAALGQVPDGAGLWPLALAQGVGLLAAVALAVTLRAPWVPRSPVVLWALLAGPLGAAAAVLFVLATQQGLLTVSSVITSLYPAVTVLLAATVLREHVHRTQGLGLALCAVAVGLVAAG